MKSVVINLSIIDISKQRRIPFNNTSCIVERMSLSQVQGLKVQVFVFLHRPCVTGGTKKINTNIDDDEQEEEEECWPIPGQRLKNF